MPFFYALTCALLVVPLLTGCPEKHNSHRGPRTVIFVKGDPMNVVKGATFRPQSPITTENYKDFEGWGIQGMVEFLEKEEENLDDKSWEKVLEEQAPTGEEDVSTKDKSSFHWQQNTPNEYVYSDSQAKLELVFTLRNGSELQLTAIRAKDKTETLPLEALHWSISEDKSMISVLIKAYTDESGTDLTAIYFSNTTLNKSSVPKTLGEYNYVAGTRIKAGWDKTRPAKLEYCGQNTHWEATELAVADWQKHLGELLKIELKKANTYYPFSDLNQHCIYPIKDRLETYGDYSATYGVTISFFNYNRPNIISSDIFVYLDEINKVKKWQGETVTETTSLTIKHELGHWLGLDHIFDGTKSIMSYQDQDGDRLTTYDIKAIRALYGNEDDFK